jgi:hypothetical protein
VWRGHLTTFLLLGHGIIGVMIDSAKSIQGFSPIMVSCDDLVYMLFASLVLREVYTAMKSSQNKLLPSAHCLQSPDAEFQQYETCWAEYITHVHL